MPKGLLTKPTKRKCVVCEKLHTPRTPNQKACSDACRQSRKNALAKQQRVRGFVSVRNCDVCGKEYRRTCGALTCGPTCRKAHRRRYDVKHKKTYEQPQKYVPILPLQRRKCVVCGAEFIPRGWQAQQCGKADCKREIRRRYESLPRVRARRRQQASDYYAKPANKARQLEYNRTSPKAKANAKRYQETGKCREYTRKSRQRIEHQKAAVELAKIAAALEAKL